MATTLPQVRVRKILTTINHDHCIEQGIIPRLGPIDKLQTKRYPTWLYKIKDEHKFSHFGLFVDYLVRKMLRAFMPHISLGSEPLLDCNIIQSQVTSYLSSTTSWQEVAYSTYDMIAQSMGVNHDISKETFNKSFSLWGKFNKDLRAVFASCKERQFYFNSEYSHQCAVGHPDLAADDMVLDIKTTANFKKMAKDSFLQVLAYVALMRANNKNIRYVGIVLPMQGTTLCYDVQTWDHTLYLQLLVNRAQMIMDRSNLQLVMDTMQNVKYMSAINKAGTHTRKLEGKIASSLEIYVQQCMSGPIKPCQMFIRGRDSGAAVIFQADIDASLVVVTKNNLSYYTHSSYCINLSHPGTKKDPTDVTWCLTILASDLQVTDSIGGKGVVVHVGKPKEEGTIRGLDIMEKSIRSVLPYATEKCPLLLETPAGQGSELCTTIEAMSNFYNRFSMEDKKIFKICIDTCHVFACGYLPLDYLQQWVKVQSTESIGLIHFNDSKEECHSRKDRHASIGGGLIGVTHLAKVAIWCVEREIDMVKE